jgi:hypothetical protein
MIDEADPCQSRGSLKDIMNDPEEMELLQRFLGTSNTKGKMAGYQRE